MPELQWKLLKPGGVPCRYAQPLGALRNVKSVHPDVTTLLKALLVRTG